MNRCRHKKKIRYILEKACDLSSFALQFVKKEGIIAEGSLSGNACKYFRKCVDVRRSGSSVIDLCNIAAGRAEMYFELALTLWDHAAAGLIVEEAGGTVTTVDGKPVRLDMLCSVKATDRVAES